MLICNNEMLTISEDSSDLQCGTMVVCSADEYNKTLYYADTEVSQMTNCFRPQITDMGEISVSSLQYYEKISNDVSGNCIYYEEIVEKKSPVSESADNFSYKVLPEEVACEIKPEFTSWYSNPVNNRSTIPTPPNTFRPISCSNLEDNSLNMNTSFKSQIGLASSNQDRKDLPWCSDNFGYIESNFVKHERCSPKKEISDPNTDDAILKWLNEEQDVSTEGRNIELIELSCDKSDSSVISIDDDSNSVFTVNNQLSPIDSKSFQDSCFLQNEISMTHEANDSSLPPIQTMFPAGSKCFMLQSINNNHKSVRSELSFNSLIRNSSTSLHISSIVSITFLIYSLKKLIHISLCYVIIN